MKRPPHCILTHNYFHANHNESLFLTQICANKNIRLIKQSIEKKQVKSLPVFFTKTMQYINDIFCDDILCMILSQLPNISKGDSLAEFDDNDDYDIFCFLCHQVKRWKCIVESVLSNKWRSIERQKNDVAPATDMELNFIIEIASDNVGLTFAAQKENNK